MKKILILALTSLPLKDIFAQKFSKIDLELSINKDNSKEEATSIQVKTNGVYKKLFYQMGRTNRFHENEISENRTVFAMGYGQIKKLKNNALNLVWGIGPTGVLLDSKNQIYLGGSGYINLYSENWEIDAGLSHAISKDNQFIAILETEGIKFFNPEMGIGLRYTLDRVSFMEAVDHGTDVISKISTFAAYKKDRFILKVGLEGTRKKIYLAKKTPEAKKWLAGISLGLLFKIE